MAHLDDLHLSVRVFVVTPIWSAVLWELWNNKNTIPSL